MKTAVSNGESYMLVCNGSSVVASFFTEGGDTANEGCCCCCVREYTVICDCPWVHENIRWLFVCLFVVLVNDVPRHSMSQAILVVVHVVNDSQKCL